jgi:hypothetical protein
VEGVLNSVVLLELITLEGKFVIRYKSLLIVVIVENGHLGSVFLLGFSNRLLGVSLIVLFSVNELNVGSVVWVSLVRVVLVSRSSNNGEHSDAHRLFHHNLL